MNNSAYTIKPFPPFRQLVIDGLEIASRKHCIHGLIEVDVTQPRHYPRDLKENTGESLSFTGFIISCCAKTVDENKHMHLIETGVIGSSCLKMWISPRP
jgi:hypothetical protein